MPVMNFDLEDGLPPVLFSINGEGAQRFMNFMAECQAIRDSATHPTDADKRDALKPNIAGEFTSYQHWVNKAQSWLKSPDHRRAMCVDSKGRRCAIGGDFMRARDEGTFPVYFFWDCEDPAIAASAKEAK